ncbi:MAG: hypothetical protein KZQ83_02715 [gamma proteobacterium symbiont of Taylorina sp.]|nr:hypothetical protein [gamma proteobacterium symbiont of Taylorina sp.]
MKQITAIVFLFIISTSLSFAYDFSYTINNPSSATADDYIVSSNNAVIQTESNYVYWKQDIGAATMDNAEPGTIIYHFNFSMSVAEAKLYIRTTTFHWTYSKGHSFIYASTDGINWIKLVEATPPPDNGGYNIQSYNQLLPDSFTGSKDIWLKVELNSYGTYADRGGAMTNTAQHSRHDIANNQKTLQLDVDYQDENMTDNQETSIDSGLIAYYPFNGNADDFSGNGHHGTENNGVIYVNGKLNQAAGFDGQDDFISIWNKEEINQYIDTSEGSISAWFNVSAEASGSSSFIFQYYGGSSDRLYLDAENTTSSNASLRLGVGDNHKLSPNKITSGLWNHAVAIWTSDGKTKLYINGIRDSEWVYGNPGFEFKGTENFYFGRGWNGNPGYFNGAIDDVKIYNRALTETEILQLSQTTPVQNTEICSDAHPEYCETESSCQSNNAYWCNNSCQESTCTQAVITNIMTTPTVTQAFNYSPLKMPVTAIKPDNAFPMGLGSAADNGEQLDLLIDINGFSTPVDIYLALYAPVLNPNDIYLFTESGGIEGLNAAGLQSWRQDQTDPVSVTVLSQIPVNVLPHGIYTFYLIVTPANTLDPLWLWSSAFQHEVIKAEFVNTVKEDNWIMTAIDHDDTYYSFFGKKDSEGELEYFEQLVLDKKDSNGDFSYYLTMDFDQYGRPVAVAMPEAGGQMLLEYISDSQISVLIKSNDGTSEKVVVDNPYGSVSTQRSEIEDEQSAATRSALLRSSDLDNRWLVSGNIIGCDDGELPKVTIIRDLPIEMRKELPQLGIIKPKISPHIDDLLTDTYSYYLQGLADYNSWYWSCSWNYSGGAIIGAIGGTAIGIMNTIYQFGSSVIKDIKADTTKNTSRNISDNIGDEIIPMWSFIRKLYELRKLPIDAHNGPCSQKVYNYLNQIQTADETVNVRLNGIIKQADFTPKPEQLSQYLTVVDAPNFDFSASCTDSEENDSEDDEENSGEDDEDGEDNPPTEGNCSIQGIALSEVMNSCDIKDSGTWQQCSDDIRYSWEDAMKYCRDLSLDGYNNWTLPTLDDYRRDGACLEDDNNGYWTSVESSTDADRAIEFDYFGNNSYARLKSTRYRVRCILN